MQKTNFNFEILIHDDASTDGTTEIIKEYEAKYPDIIKPIYQTENQYSKKNKRILTEFVFPKTKGKYIALCEGDDFWTDPLKLQKQVDFLEAHPDYVICFHPVNIKYEEIKETHKQTNYLYNKKTFFTFNDLIEYGNFIHTPSVVLKNGLIKSFPDWYAKMPAGDFPLYCLLTKIDEKCNKIGIISDYMATYRIHKGGVWSCTKHTVQIENTIVIYLELANNFNLFTDMHWIKAVSRIYTTLAYEYFKSLNLKKALSTLYAAVKTTSFKDITKAFIFLFTKKIHKLLKKQSHV